MPNLRLVLWSASARRLLVQSELCGCGCVGLAEPEKLAQMVGVATPNLCGLLWLASAVLCFLMKP